MNRLRVSVLRPSMRPEIINPRNAGELSNNGSISSVA